jgi:hypothetical protein
MSSIGTRTRRVSRWVGVCAAGLFALTATGCFFEASTDAGPTPTPIPPPIPPGPVPGSLTLRWTVESRTDPNLCVLGRASTFDVILTTTAGQFAGEFQAGCGAFATTVSSLAPGGYSGSALLLDSSGRERTTAISINGFTILENTNLVIDLDFPADSFL